MSSSERGRPDLSVIIPVYNAGDTIEQLVSDFLAVEGLQLQILLVDDCSSDNSAEVMRKLSKADSRIEAIYHEHNSGAGVARNKAIPHAKGEFTIFFDADDIVHGDVVSECVDQLRETGADLAMMPYFYQKGDRPGRDEMNLNDAKIWNKVIKGQSLRSARLDDCADVLGFSNYPWNKILRTDSYSSVGIKFGRTIVNNDILGHWYSLLFADKILLLNREICTHVVTATGNNLTNQHSRVRMQLFDALDETYDVLEKHPDLRGRFSHHFWALALRTMLWARARIDPAMKNEFNARFQDLLMRMDLRDYVKMRTGLMPSLADDLKDYMLA